LTPTSGGGAFLDQRRAKEAIVFFQTLPSERIHLTDFALHSIALILNGAGRRDVFADFVSRLVDGRVKLIHLAPTEYMAVIESMKDFDLDFDDAYQYVACERRGLQLVSFTRTSIVRREAERHPGKWSMRYPERRFPRLGRRREGMRMSSASHPKRFTTEPRRARRSPTDQVK